jgi:outer membrane protein OmpA-like peptidoglycan-associated protein
VKVRDWLVDHGVAPDRPEVADAGAAGPLLTETTPHRRALNRRVSFEPIEAPAR